MEEEKLMRRFAGSLSGYRRDNLLVLAHTLGIGDIGTVAVLQARIEAYNQQNQERLAGNPHLEGLSLLSRMRNHIRRATNAPTQAWSSKADLQPQLGSAQSQLHPLNTPSPSIPTYVGPDFMPPFWLPFGEVDLSALLSFPTPTFDPSIAFQDGEASINVDSY